MDATFFAALLLSLSGGPAIPPGSGTFSQLIGDPGWYSWRLEGGYSGSDVGSLARAPGVCMSTCTFDFSQVVGIRMPYFTATHVIIPQFTFTGPVVSATARCIICSGFGAEWETVWAPTPVRFSAVVVVRSLADPLDRQEVTLVGSGVGTARNYQLYEAGPWNYSEVRYDFSYVVAPEPGGAGIVAVLGGVVLAVGWRRRRAGGPRVG